MPVFDGTTVDLQDRDGTLGTTSGNIVYVQKIEDLSRSRPIRVTQLGLVIDQSEVHRLLRTIIKQLESIEGNIDSL